MSHRLSSTSMSVSASEIAELRELRRTAPEEPDLDLIEFTFEEHIAFMVACCREKGWDEADAVETVLRLLELPPDEARDLEKVLRPLGYREVCTRLRQITGRRKHSLVPLV